MTGSIPSSALFDAHCHLSFAPQTARFAEWVANNQAGAFSTTVSPADHAYAKEVLSGWESLKVGLGAHPWWVSRGEVSMEDIERLASLVPETRFIGEIGLDFGKNGLAKRAFDTEEETKATQVEALRAVFAACVQGKDLQKGALDPPGAPQDSGGRVLSIHAVRSADVIMDMLQEYGLLPGNTVIFHWFSGSSAQLQRAREMGCFFSVNAFMLNTRRGREYAKAIPLGQLLVETDLPEDPRGGQEKGGRLDGDDRPECDEQAFDAACSFYEGALVSAYDQLIELRGEAVLRALQQNVQAIFG